MVCTLVCPSNFPIIADLRRPASRRWRNGAAGHEIAGCVSRRGVGVLAAAGSCGDRRAAATVKSLAAASRITPIKRLHADIKRRTNVVGIFPTEDAITRPVGAVLLAQNDGGRLKEMRYAGIHRSRERHSDRQAARRGSLDVPTLPAGCRDARLLHHGPGHDPMSDPDSRGIRQVDTSWRGAFRVQWLRTSVLMRSTRYRLAATCRRSSTPTGSSGAPAVPSPGGGRRPVSRSPASWLRRAPAGLLLALAGSLAGTTANAQTVIWQGNLTVGESSDLRIGWGGHYGSLTASPSFQRDRFGEPTHADVTRVQREVTVEILDNDRTTLSITCSRAEEDSRGIRQGGAEVIQSGA